MEGTVGRHTEASEDEREAGVQKLHDTGTGGWLAVMEGSHYSRGRATLLMAREIAPHAGRWDDAVTLSTGGGKV